MYICTCVKQQHTYVYACPFTTAHCTAHTQCMCNVHTQTLHMSTTLGSVHPSEYRCICVCTYMRSHHHVYTCMHIYKHTLCNTHNVHTQTTHSHTHHTTIHPIKPHHITHIFRIHQRLKYSVWVVRGKRSLSAGSGVYRTDQPLQLARHLH